MIYKSQSNFAIYKLQMRVLYVRFISLQSKVPKLDILRFITRKVGCLFARNRCGIRPSQANLLFLSTPRTINLSNTQAICTFGTKAELTRCLHDAGSIWDPTSFPRLFSPPARFLTKKTIPRLKLLWFACLKLGRDPSFHPDPFWRRSE